MKKDKMETIVDEKPIEEKQATVPAEPMHADDLVEVSEAEVARENALAAGEFGSELAFEGFASSGRLGKAKKDFDIYHNGEHFSIKKGDEISDSKVPAKFHANLRAEGVI